MSLNIVCTAKPYDGLFYYSYEYAATLEANLIIITWPSYTKADYEMSISRKYNKKINVSYNDYDEDGVVLIMGRSMLTLPHININNYTQNQLLAMYGLFSGPIISVYSENHSTEYDNAVQRFNPEIIYDLCDTEVYPRGHGQHFEKRINFSILKDPIQDIKFKYLFLGTNPDYYKSAKKYIGKYKDYGIITPKGKWINKNLNNIIVPVDNLLGSFDTYVYTKETFDPAPRLIQECKYYNKKIIYSRDNSIEDGGKIYFWRPIKEIDVEPILIAYENIL